MGSHSACRALVRRTILLVPRIFSGLDMPAETSFHELGSNSAAVPKEDTKIELFVCVPRRLANCGTAANRLRLAPAEVGTIRGRSAY